MKDLKHYLIEEQKFHFLNPETENEINIFDIDETLILTNAKIKVHDTVTNEYFELTPSEFNHYKKKDSHKLDFSDFHSLEILKAGKIIGWVFDILKRTLAKKKAVGIITARADRDLVFDFLESNGVRIKKDFIFAISDPRLDFTGSVAEKKKQAFEKFLKMGFNKFRFFDDSKENLDFAKKFAKENPGVEMYTKFIDSRWLPK